MPSGFRIRSVREGDAERVAEICILTGDAGADATGVLERPELLPQVYALPYLALAPELAFVLVRADDEALPYGYVLGVADTRQFAARLEDEWWPAVRTAYPRGSAPPGTRDAHLLEALHDPERLGDDVLDEYPAHLHVDLLPSAQGGGNGRALLERLFEALRAQGVPGLHLGIDPANVRARGFYEHLGFREVAAGLLGITL